MISISLLCQPELKTWCYAISRVAGIYSLTVCTERKGINNGEHETVSQSTHSSGYQISLLFSREHLSLPHGSQPKDPSFSASSLMCRNSGSHMSHPWGPCINPYNLVTYELQRQIFCPLSPLTHPNPTSISNVHCKGGKNDEGLLGSPCKGSLWEVGGEVLDEILIRPLGEIALCSVVDGPILNIFSMTVSAVGLGNLLFLRPAHHSLLIIF